MKLYHATLGINIIDQNQMVQLSSLRAVYIDALGDGGSPNPDFSGEKHVQQIKNDKQFEDEIKCFKVSSDKQGLTIPWQSLYALQEFQMNLSGV